MSQPSVQQPNFPSYPKDNRYIPDPELGLIYSTIRKRYLKGTPTNDNYLRVKIQGKPEYVHRVMAETYIPNPDNKPMVHHINSVPNDNRLCNLQRVTEKENNDAKFQAGSVTRRRKVVIPPGTSFTGFHFKDKEYPTLKDLALDNDIVISTASTWFLQGKINYTIDHEVQTEIVYNTHLLKGLNIPVGSTFTGFHYNGKVYECLAQIANDEGVAEQTVRRWFGRGKVNYSVDGKIIDQSNSVQKQNA